MLQHVGDHAAEFTTEYGNVRRRRSARSSADCSRSRRKAREAFFGEPMLNIDDLMQTDRGRGVVNILAADRLLGSPKVYGTFLLWLLAELFEQLPEIGDPDKPRIVFFFDEAHLLFADAPKALLDKIEQVVRLIRSKGVGVYFVTQNPLDIPDRFSGSSAIACSTRCARSRRAIRSAVRAVAQTMRPNPELSIEQAIRELGVGEALVSLLDDRAGPSVTERALIIPPGSRVGPLSADERARVIAASPLAGHYERAIDRESAYEKLKTRVGAAADTEPASAPRVAATREPPSRNRSSRNRTRAASRPTSCSAGEDRAAAGNRRD